MRIVIIGGSGHVGTYLVPRLVRLGHEVTSVTRGRSQPYAADPAWESVRQVRLDREAEEKEGTFGRKIRDLKPDVVIDMICFHPDSARQIVESLRGEVQQFLHCGTIWVHGCSAEVPTTEDQRREPFGEYGVRKCAIEQYLVDEAHRHGFPATALHPGHIVGPGYGLVGPTACHDLAPIARLARGEKVALPDLGMGTVHHVHADDVAQAFVQAMACWSAAVGESFYVVSRAALTLRGYAEAVAGWFGKKADLEFLPLREWLKTQQPEFAGSAEAHIAHSSNFSCAKAMRRLGFRPRYTSLEACRESVAWLIASGCITI